MPEISVIVPVYKVEQYLKKKFLPKRENPLHALPAKKVLSPVLAIFSSYFGRQADAIAY